MKSLLILLSAATAAIAQISMNEAQMKKLGITVGSVSTVQSSTLGPIIGTLDFDEEKSKSYFLDHEAAVVSLSVRAGDRVHQGQVLAKISSPKLLADTYELALFKQQYKVLKNNAQKDETLYKDGVIAYRDYQSSLLEAEAVRSRIGLLESQFALAGVQSGSTMALIARKSGIVSLAPKSVGEKITPYVPYFRISTPESMIAQLKISPKLISQVKKGTNVLDKNAQPIGTIISISPAVNTITNSATAIARIQDKTNQLRAGTTAEFFLVAPKAAVSILIPASAVVKHQGKHICFIRTATGFKAQELLVKSISKEGVSVNQKGIDPNTKVAISGLITLKGALSGLGFE